MQNSSCKSMHVCSWLLKSVTLPAEPELFSNEYEALKILTIGVALCVKMCSVRHSRVCTFSFWCVFQVDVWFASNSRTSFSSKRLSCTFHYLALQWNELGIPTFDSNKNNNYIRYNLHAVPVQCYGVCAWYPLKSLKLKAITNSNNKGQA